MSFAVVTVHFQNPSSTIRLVGALENCESVHSILVISHDSFQMENRGKVVCFQQPNKGYASGLNFGVKHLPAEIRTVLAVNPDVILDCEKMKALYSQHLAAGAGCTFPVLMEMKGRMVYGYRFSRFGSLLNTKDPEWFSGACFLFSVEAWEKAGGFDETLFHYFEDRDFCLKVLKAGFMLHQAPDVLVEHEGKSGENYPETSLPKFAVKNHLLALERGKLLGPLSFMNVVLRHFLYLFHWKRAWRGIPEWLKGIREFLTHTESAVVE
jgi:GT2 family glycosyltransferase